jgi:hypothetical protein
VVVGHLSLVVAAAGGGGGDDDVARGRLPP